MVTFEKSCIGIKTIYRIEYIQDPQKWKIMCSDKQPAPWTLYDVRTYDSLDDAITFYLIQFFYDKCFDVKMFEEITLNGEIVRESYIEPKNTFVYSMRKIINESAIAKIERLQEMVESLNYSMESYQKFIEKYHAEKHYNDFVRDYLQ